MEERPATFKEKRDQDNCYGLSICIPENFGCQLYIPSSVGPNNVKFDSALLTGEKRMQNYLQPCIFQYDHACVRL